MSRITALIIAIVVFAAGAAVGHWGSRASRAPEAPSAATPAASAPDTRRVLYWYDPMKPDQHFDRPGKSPFMDMELQPKYADEDAAATVRVDPVLAQNLGVRTTTVVAAPLPALAPLPGVVQWDARHVAVVQTRAAGFVTRVFDRAPGDRVARAAPLADLHVPAWAGPQAEYLALRGRGDATLAAAARTRLAVLGVPEAAIAQAERDGRPVTTIRIATPLDGVITALDVRAGMRLEEGATLATINGIDEVWIEAAWPLLRSAEANPGARVLITVDALPGARLEGRIDAVLPDVDADSRTIKVRIVLPNPGGHLRPGLYATVALAAADDSPVLQVPDSAVVRTTGGDLVFVALDDGRFKPVTVALGRTAGGRVEVRAGLTAGERIVESGQFLLDSEANLAGTLPQFGAQDALAPAPSPAAAVHAHDAAQEHPHD
ncbi:MAG: efflux RND transporter periplasmic adaptor subunit [Gammaproteobacteria bacterium]